jgi:hypothetical protein
VRPAGLFVPALADHLAAPDDDGAHDRVRVRRPTAALGQLERPFEEGHANAWTNRL